MMLQKINNFIYLILFLLPFLFLTSCGDKKRNIFNASRKQVDSNLVVINNPLTLPPFFFLPEPKPSKASESIAKISKSNQDAVFNTSSPIQQNIPITNTDNEFLNLVGYNNAKKDIRELLDKEINSLIEKEDTFLDKIFNYISKENNQDKNIKEEESKN